MDKIKRLVEQLYIDKDLFDLYNYNQTEILKYKTVTIKRCITTITLSINNKVYPVDEELTKTLHDIFDYKAIDELFKEYD